jgi:integrase
LWATAFYAGLRRGELRALRDDDVDLRANLIHVRRSWDEKEGEIAPKSDKGTRARPFQWYCAATCSRIAPAPAAAEPTCSSAAPRACRSHRRP